MTTYRKSNIRNKLIGGSVAAVVGVGLIGYGLSNLDAPENTNVPVKGRSSSVQTTSTYSAPEATSTPEQEETTKPATRKPTAKKTTKPKPTSTEVYYANCTEVWNSGDPDGLRRGEPGYRSGLDSDGDGTACENRG